MLAVFLRGCGGLLVFLFLVEEENNVGSVGCVAQSEKSAENIQQIVFRNGYTAEIGYISRLDRVEYHAIEDRLMNAEADRRLTKNKWVTKGQI